MEQFDSALEKRVWQRVHGCHSPEETPPGLQALGLAEQASAATYLMLARMAQGPEKNLLRQLFERERQHSRLLSGIFFLRDGSPMALRTIPPEQGRTGIVLRKCYSRTLEAMAHYAALEGDPHYGCIFRKLLQQEQEHCAMIAEILGMNSR